MIDRLVLLWLLAGGVLGAVVAVVTAVMAGGDPDDDLPAAPVDDDLTEAIPGAAPSQFLAQIELE